MSDAPFPDRLAQLRQRWDSDRSSRLFLQLAEEYRHRGQIREALGVLDEGLKGHPGYLSALVAKGRCHLELGQPVEARTALDRVVRQDPTQEVASKLLVRALVELGAFVEARERLRLYRLLHESDPEVAELERRIEAAEAPPSKPEPEIQEALAIATAESPTDVVPSATIPDRDSLVAEESAVDRGRGSETMTEDLFDLAPAPPALPTFSPNDDLFGLYVQEAVADTGVPPSSSPESLFPELEGRFDRGHWQAALAQEGLFDFDPLDAAVAAPKVATALAPESLDPIVPFDADETIDARPSEPEPHAAVASFSANEFDLEPEPEYETEGPPLSIGAAVATVTLAELYSRQGHATEAERIYREVLAREPENAAARQGLASLVPPAVSAPVVESVPQAVETEIFVASPEPIALVAPVAASPVGDPRQRKIDRLMGYLERLRRGRARLVS